MYGTNVGGPAASTPDRRAGRRLAAAGLSGAVAVAGTAVLAGARPADAGTAATSTPADRCRVVRLGEPEWGGDGGVMDIEKVGRRVYYYGNTYQVSRDGEDHQRALVWRGRRATPERVGPRGYDEDIALELTETGLVNGTSTDWSSGTTVAWVQDLATMELTYFDVGGSGSEHGVPWIRRINDDGAAAGQLGRSSDPEEWASDAVGFSGPESSVQLLPGSARAHDAGAFGINEAGDRVGYLAREFHPDHPDCLMWDPVLWSSDGQVTELVTPHGLDALPRMVKDDGSASGLILWGNRPASAHLEAAYWPTPGENVGLGVLPSGSYSDAFGMDEGGWLTGAMDRIVANPSRNRFDEDGAVLHSFLWTEDIGPGAVRILPSLYGVRHDLPVRSWAGSAAHAVNGELDQAGSGSHWRFRGKRPVYAPTVYLGAGSCGAVRETTHRPAGAGAGTAAGQVISPARSKRQLFSPDPAGR